MSLIFAVILSLLVAIQAQGPPAAPPGPPGAAGITPSQFYQNYVLQAAAARLSTADLPEDLQIQAGQALANAELGFAACDELATIPIAIWQQKKCSVFQLRNTLIQLALIQREADLRNITAAIVKDANASSGQQVAV